ncbi:NADPH2:quinone reductase [Singulisphaera sp. GP187]|uniref:quinone oxidoreductase family protein n=1 Tax=Singulisphaera sp. GP187 TaxID=1882752 RepID=UPI00092620FC|nr:quinone oxidoreductase [Singulisphaera sp. GP187]SIO67924.1 NADPH2:quinone reductase [Singulisphaera sp. GP187]
MPKSIRITRTGGPDVMRWEDVEVGAPGEGQARIRHTAVGVNLLDTYHRSGLYPLPLPTVLGSEAAGIVEAVGPGVTVVKLGDRVAYGGGPPGSYAERRLIPAQILVPIPEEVSDETAAAVMLKGMTSQYLIRRTYPVKAGETVLFHAAAGGVGLIACQWLKALGATVIGTVGSDAKAEIAKAHGCDHVIVSTREDLAKRVREITGGAGVPVVYDSVGKDTFLASIDCLKPRGLMVSFGNASGKVPPFDIGILAQKGSLYLTRPTLATYTASRADLEATAKDVFGVIREGKVKVEIRHTYPLAEAAQAHRDLEGRKTVGSIVMEP